MALSSAWRAREHWAALGAWECIEVGTGLRGGLEGRREGLDVAFQGGGSQAGVHRRVEEAEYRRGRVIGAGLSARLALGTTKLPSLFVFGEGASYPLFWDLRLQKKRVRRPFCLAQRADIRCPAVRTKVLASSCRDGAAVRRLGRACLPEDAFEHREICTGPPQFRIP